MSCLFITKQGHGDIWAWAGAEDCLGPWSCRNLKVMLNLHHTSLALGDVVLPLAGLCRRKVRLFYTRAGPSDPPALGDLTPFLIGDLTLHSGKLVSDLISGMEALTVMTWAQESWLHPLLEGGAIPAEAVVDPLSCHPDSQSVL